MAKKVAAKTVKTAKKVRTSEKKSAPEESAGGRAKFPRHAVAKSLRIAGAILEQNAGKPCTAEDAARFLGMGSNGPFNVEISSGIKYGFLDRPEKGKLQPTALAKKALRPQSPSDALDAYREAIMQAPEISDVYRHYRGENLPDDQFLKNALTDTFHIPAEHVSDFKHVFMESLETAQLLVKHGEKYRVADVSDAIPDAGVSSGELKKLGKAVNVSSTDSCFVMQPFASPLGDYYEKIYKISIEKAGLKPVRADADIFHTGKIMDQIWSGISEAKVLVAELTSRNPNVFYELGLAHALQKPVVLVSSKEDDVPFDLQHIRVIYYDVTDPFWGSKLIEKVAENILSAIHNPDEAILKRATSSKSE
jgi:hypothetical protein